MWCAFFPTVQRTLVSLTYQFHLSGSAEIPGLVEETITLSINANEPIFTLHRYSGSVTIGVQGEAQINATTGHDGLYIYNFAFEDGKHQYEDGKQRLYCCFGGLEIDGEAVNHFSFFPGGGMRTTTGGSPNYNSSHQYYFLYDIGPILRKISFRIQNDNPQDLTSQFIIEVSTGDKVFGFAR